MINDDDFNNNNNNKVIQYWNIDLIRRIKY
jgi:hypothetical protein